VNERDFNGYTPDPDESARGADESARDPREDVTSGSRAALEKLSPPADPALRSAWLDGYLAAVGIVAARAQEQLDAALETVAARGTT
jgi:hypothetical protein